MAAVVVLMAADPPSLPCRFDGQLLQGPKGEIVRFTSVQMKNRATRKVDIAGPITQLDIQSGVLVSVLVGVKGEVVCLRTVSGFKLAQAEVEKALRSWRFEPAEMDGKPVAYLGWLEFVLCNLGCGERGPSMTLLQ